MYNIIHKKTQNDEYAFQIDSSTNEIVGWVVGKQHLITEVSVRYIDEEQIFPLNKIRPNVKNSCPTYVRNDSCGFAFRPTKSETFDLGVVIDGQFKVLTTAYHHESINKLIFIHIAKTAGSTINNVLMSRFGAIDSLTHIESIPNWPSQVQDKIFISGHIILEEFKSKLSFLDQSYLITSVREPVSHVISHLSWIRHLSENGEESKFNAHPEYIQQLSLKMKNTDLSSYESLTTLIQSLTPKELNLLDNTQTRYLRKKIGKPVSSSDVDDAISNLSWLDVIGFDDDINAFLQKICNDWYLPLPSNQNKDNALQSKFGLENTSLFKSALMPLIQHDLDMYERLRALKGDSPVLSLKSNAGHNITKKMEPS